MNDEITSSDFHERLRKRNKEAFKVLYEQFKIPLYHLIYSIIKDNEKTADIIQDTFIKVINNIGQLEDIRKIKFWIFRIAINLTINAIKKDKRFSYAGDNLEFIVDHAMNESIPILDNQETEELFLLIRNRVASLPLKQRVVFTLKYVDNLKEMEIAEILGIPVGTVKSRLNIARNRIKNDLNHSIHSSPERLS